MHAYLVLLLTLSACTADSNDTAPTDTAPDDTSPHVENGDVLALMAATEQIVWREWPDALLMYVAGENDLISGSTSHEDFGSWYLIFCANDGSDGSVEIRWTAGDGFAGPTYDPDPFYSVRYEPIPRTLNLDGALALAEEAGMFHPFTYATIGTPDSPALDARYTLTHDSGRVFVDIATGAVSEE